MRPPGLVIEILEARLGVLALLAAMGYGVATIGKKLASDRWSVPATGSILLIFAGLAMVSH